VRLGYLRKGDTVAVKPQMLRKPSCPEGWYELRAPPGSPAGSTGGFVCGKHVTLDPDDKELASAPRAPNMTGPLPYDYGLNLVDGAPLYRRPPLRRERKQYESGLAVGRAYRNKDGDDGAPAPEAAGSHDEDNSAWYLAHKGRSQLSMDDLKGETSLIVQRMVKGFYLGLDKEVHAFSGTFWRTTRGMFVPRAYGSTRRASRGTCRSAGSPTRTSGSTPSTTTRRCTGASTSTASPSSSSRAKSAPSKTKRTGKRPKAGGCVPWTAR
jgi:hypothetical protein